MTSSLESKIDFIAPLAELSSADLACAGGKGANLGELVRAGFPVPEGFVLTTRAYERFVAQHRLERTITGVLRDQPGSGAAIREAFAAAAIPTEIEREIVAAYSRLGRVHVAVRSSATAEDLPGAAFAGQQETFLNVSGEEALLDAVRRCWASLWGDRAIAYRARLPLDQHTLKIAVVVQRMVAAEYAGVLFSANPVTGARDETVIDTNPGLGEAVVSGLATPDHFVLRKHGLGWKITERRPGLREVIIRPRAGGGTETLQGLAAASAVAPPAPTLRRLARLGRRIQRHFGSPQDVEWAWAGGRPFILQARPITALPAPLPHMNRLQRMLASNFVEMLPYRPYPLDLDTWLPALSTAVDPIFELLGFDWNLGQLFAIEDGVVTQYRTNLPHLTWRIVLAPLRLVALGLRYNPLHWQSDPLLAETQARARELGAIDLRARSWKDLLALVSAIGEIPFHAAGELRRRYFPRAVFSGARLRLLLGLLGRPDRFGVLLSGVENKTLEANQALEQLAAQVRSDPGLAALFASHQPLDLWPMLEGQPSGRAFLAALRIFLDRYGHRETIISTALQPTWKDAPEVVLGIVKSFAAGPPQPRPGEPAWQVARDELLRHPLLRLAPLRSAFLGILEEARTLLQIREDTHFYATMALPLFRRTLLELGRRLASDGILDAPEDVFSLRLGELEQLDGKQPSAGCAAELRAASLRRKQARAGLDGQPLVDPRLYPRSAPAGEALLHGMVGSPGVVEGAARIIRGASEFDRLVTGEVLVAPYTNPSWTPLFQRAAAVVVDSGSPASHAAIVAREYGIPAVMSTVTGTQMLRDGERIRVDGNQGLVFRAAPPAETRQGEPAAAAAQGPDREKKDDR